MQPYSYVSYPQAAGTAMAVPYPMPVNYQPVSPRVVHRSFDPYSRRPVPVQPVQYVPQRIQYVPPPVQAVVPIVSPPQPVQTVVPIVSPPQPVQTVVPIVAAQQPAVYSQPFQYAPTYYYDPNASNQVKHPAPAHPHSKKLPPKHVPPGHKDHRHPVAPAPGPNSMHNQIMKGINANATAKDLINQKGSKIRVSKIYRISNKSRDFQDSSDDEFERVTLPPSPVRTVRQPPRVPSTTSSCSHCSECSDCSCSACRHENRKHPYDDCPTCRAEREREQTHIRRHKLK